MFPYFGSKGRLAHLYPAPRGGRVFEPFAGSARYSLLHRSHDVWINDIDPLIYRIWRYIQQASRSPGNTGEVLMSILERRLDNIVRRAGFARTIWAARQMVSHGHVLVNGRKTDRASAILKVGDAVTLKPKIQKLAKEAMEGLAGHEVPGWIEVNPSELTVRVAAMPTTDQIPFDCNTNLIVEFYR